ncbi:hypothetical protein PA598K_03179 [Paenibacillus sp. 598K]|uniref:AraC family transcriptional regulator n=1 Tax=Paenibacillus sp. 598K TaxID=1117987 RepID=UPI000FFA00AF|nr:AraC family transcriptional regulator [Paenibacillus sp. 598K]GBF74811.1 hypothetical protein PA598K_03179 [Paenibacillus sp. 598K]
MHRSNTSDRHVEHDSDHVYLRLQAVEALGDQHGSWRLQTQFLEQQVLLCITSGHGTLTLDGRYIELRPGTVYACGAGQLAEATVQAMDERGCYAIHYDRYTAAGDPARLILHPGVDTNIPGELTAESPLRLAMLCAEIHRLWQAGTDLDRFGAQTRFQEMVYQLLLHARAPVSDEQAALDAARMYIERHYREKITIDDLAGVARMSARHLMRRFKQRYGCSAMDYLTIYRIQEAQKLMRIEPPPPLKEVGSQVGYQDDIYFRRKFRQIVGIAPAAYVRNSRRRVVACHPQAIGILLALQTIPCAAPASHPWTSYYRRKYATDRVMPLSDLPGERLAQLQASGADAILATGGRLSEAELAELRSIAAVCEIPWQGQDWREHLRYAAQWLGIAGMADTWLARYEQKAAAVRAQIDPMIGEQRLLILQVTAERLLVPGAHSMAEVLHGDLAIRQAEPLQDRRTPEIKLEELRQLRFDRLLAVIDDDDGARARWQSMTLSASWCELDAVRQRRVDTLDVTPLHDYTAFTHELLLEEIWKLWHDRA